MGSAPAQTYIVELVQASMDKEGSRLLGSPDPGAVDPGAVDSAAIEQRLGVRFRDRGVLAMALTHTSYVNEHPGEGLESNERLEFLGDALLGLVIAARLYRDHPQMPEGALTSARASLVRGESLAAVSRGLGLGDGLLLGQGEEATGGRKRSSNLAGALEAAIGAVLVDRGFQEARKLVLRLFDEGLKGLEAHPVPQDPKSRLQELAQGRGEGTPVYRIVAEAGPGHAREFTAQVLLGERVLGEGRGWRKLDAERHAALEALEAMDSPAEAPGGGSEG